MKRLVACFILFFAALIGTAVYYSPLLRLGTPELYYSNEAAGALDGLCYPAEAECRVDFPGGESELFSALEKIDCRVIRVDRTDGLTVVYGYSDRVRAETKRLSNGAAYNVMGASRGGRACVGVPILQGSY